MKKVLFAPLTKVRELDDGTVEIFARAVAEEPDPRKEICDYATTKPEIMAWSDEIEKASGGKSLGNLRAMHNPKLAAGKLTEINYLDEEKAVDIVARVIDPVEVTKVREGVYTGISIGGDYANKWLDGPYMRYTARPHEFSLADRPMIKSCQITLIKVDGSEMEMELGKADAGYADPGLQKDKKPRYPMKLNGELNEKRTRAAWNYINKPKTAEKYAADDLTKVKETIVLAWEEKIDPAGPPSAVGKVAQAGEMHKSLYQLANLAELLQALQSLSHEMDWDAFAEMDDSPVPEQLKAWMEAGAFILKAMADEEVGELLEDLMVKVEGPQVGAPPLAKVGAEISGKNKDYIQQIHDHAAALGAACGGEGMTKVAEGPQAGTPAPQDSLAKVAALEADIQAKDAELAKVSTGLEEHKAELAKVSTGLKEKEAELAKVAGEKAVLQTEVDELKKQPAPAKGVLREGLSAPSKEEDVLEKVAAPEEPKTPLEAVKLAHQNPFIISGR